MKRLIAILMLLVTSVARGADATHDEEIEHLIRFVEESEVVFIRNGSDHTAADAAEHIKKKREHFKNRIKSAEDFIALAASGSIVGKEPYRIRMKDGTTMTSAAWLGAELKRLREGPRHE